MLVTSRTALTKLLFMGACFELSSAAFPRGTACDGACSQPPRISKRDTRSTPTLLLQQPVPPSRRLPPALRAIWKNDDDLLMQCSLIDEPFRLRIFSA